MAGKFINIRVTEKQKSDIAALAKKANATITDFILSRVLDIPLVDRPEKIVYITKTYKSKNKKKKLQEV